MKPQVTVVLGSGAIAVAIARRVSTGNHVLLADLRLENAEKAAQTLREAGFECSTMAMDVSDRASVQAVADRAAALGDVRYVINSAGVSPSQASPQAIAKVDLYDTALVLEIFGDVIAEGGAGVVIGSQSSHRLPPLDESDLRDLATTPTEQLLDLPLVKEIDDSLRAYQIAKKANALRVQMEAVRSGQLHQPRYRLHAAGVGRVKWRAKGFLPRYARQSARRAWWHARRSGCAGRNGFNRWLYHRQRFSD